MHDTPYPISQPWYDLFYWAQSLTYRVDGKPGVGLSKEDQGQLFSLVGKCAATKEYALDRAEACDREAARWREKAKAIPNA